VQDEPGCEMEIGVVATTSTRSNDPTSGCPESLKVNRRIQIARNGPDGGAGRRAWRETRGKGYFPPKTVLFSRWFLFYAFWTQNETDISFCNFATELRTDWVLQTIGSFTHKLTHDSHEQFHNLWPPSLVICFTFPHIHKSSLESDSYLGIIDMLLEISITVLSMMSEVGLNGRFKSNLPRRSIYRLHFA